MSADETREGFLRRWSRQKVEAREAPPASPAVPAREAAAQEPVPVLPPVDELTIDSDFKAFFHPKVGEDVRRSALRKLFSDPHFNVMDGLDTYIDDYSVSVPIPPEMLAGMRQAQRILEWAAETEEEATLRRATPPALPVDDEEAASEAATEALDKPTGTPEVATSPLRAPRDDKTATSPLPSPCDDMHPAPRGDTPIVVAGNSVTKQSRESPGS